VRIGLLTTSFPRFDGDYAGCFIADRAGALAAQGHAVDVLAAGDPSLPGAGWSPATAGIEVVRVVDADPADPADPSVAPPPLFYGPGAPERLERGGAGPWLLAARFSVALAAAARARAARWDAIEAHWLLPCALAAMSAAPALPLTAFAHSGDVSLLERLPLGRTLARQLAAATADIRFVTSALRDRFAALAGRAVGTVAPLPAPPSFARRGHAPDPALRRQLALTSPTLLAVGRLVPIKGHDRLLRACARARATDLSRVDPEVVILGDGPERARLTALAARLDVRLRLPGFVPRPEVARWLAAADLFVQPSIRLATGRSEGAPLATAEARAVGIPVVVDSDPGRLAVAISTLAAARNPIVTGV
jgi:glycosyltransferase involved in cell wall biosynthesis